MDPDANLAEQRQIVERRLNGRARLEDYWRLVDLVQALDQWIAGGGFLPEAWRREG